MLGNQKGGWEVDWLCKHFFQHNIFKYQENLKIFSNVPGVKKNDFEISFFFNLRYHKTIPTSPRQNRQMDKLTKGRTLSP